MSSISNEIVKCILQNQPSQMLLIHSGAVNRYGACAKYALISHINTKKGTICVRLILLFLRNCAEMKDSLHMRICILAGAKGRTLLRMSRKPLKICWCNWGSDITFGQLDGFYFSYSIPQISKELICFGLQMMRFSILS